MPRETVALPPILLPTALHDALEATRSTPLLRALGVLPSSRTSVFTEAVAIGLRDLAEELRERAGTSLDASPGSIAKEFREAAFSVASPPRGSRWAANSSARGAAKKRANRGAGVAVPTGFVRLTTMVVARDLLGAIDAMRDEFDKHAPGLVASRAALIREALARGLAAHEHQRKAHEELARRIEAVPTPIPPEACSIPLDVLFPPSERARSTPTVPTPSGVTAPAQPARRTQRRPRSRRAKRRRVRTGDPDDDPARQCARHTHESAQRSP